MARGLTGLIEAWERGARGSLIAGCLFLALVIGVIDYLTGSELSLHTFYLIPIIPAVWFGNRLIGVWVATFSTAVSITANELIRVPHQSPHVIAWNALVLMLFYLVVILILDRWHDLQQNLGKAVQQRTAALQAEVRERQRLEKEVLSISEREQQRIGRDLHDGLCQHLTATALAGKVLEEQLGSQPVPAAAAQRVVGMVEESIALARNLAHGLMPAELEGAGLMEALERLAETITEQAHLDCRFICDTPVLIPEITTAMHLYRTAQEAVANAINHGHAKQITIHLAKTEAGTELEIANDGESLPDPLPESPGLGLRIMTHRAMMIGGALTIRRGESGGTVVTCILS